jgi:hypothetical protein
MRFKQAKAFMKKNKQVVFASIFILLCGNDAGAQSGVFKNAADYKNNRLTYECNCGTSKNNIHLRNFFGESKSIVVNSEGKKYKLKKRTIYGFRNCKKELFRLYGNVAYELVEAGKIIIYRKQEHVAQGKGFKVVNVYSFSTTAESDIVPLTFHNLEDAYGNNENFIDLLYQYKGAMEAFAYDKAHATFKINYLYSKSVK